MKVIFTMRKALSDPQLLADAMRGPSWEPWRILLIAAAGEALTDDERAVFKRLTGRDREPGAMVEVLLVVAGRRSGKSKAAAAFMAWLATCCDWTENLSLGETGVALLVSPTERQAGVTDDYIRAIVEHVPLLSALVEGRVTQGGLNLKRQARIEILPANSKWIRGLTGIGVALDETAFLPSNEDSAQSDISILEALRPSVATTSAPVVITSSPATTTGVVHSIWQKHYGKDGDPAILVVQSDSRGLNPTLREGLIARALETDPTAARSEFLGEFRDPMTGYISREELERLVAKGVKERPPQRGVQYKCFTDTAGGNGQDWFAAVIGHFEKDGDQRRIVVDMLHGQPPPFNPDATIAALAGKLQPYGIREVWGDRFAGGFVPTAFAKHNIQYRNCSLSASELYVAALPVFTSGAISLLDLGILFDQLCNLRRKIGQAGKESITHMRGQHDDAANALCGLIHILTPVERAGPGSFGGFGVVTAPRTGFPGSTPEDVAWMAAGGRFRPGGNGDSVIW